MSSIKPFCTNRKCEHVIYYPNFGHGLKLTFHVKNDPFAMEHCAKFDHPDIQCPRDHNCTMRDCRFYHFSD